MNAEKQKRTSNPGLPPRVDHERVIGSRREVMYNMQKCQNESVISLCPTPESRTVDRDIDAKNTRRGSNRRVIA